MNFKKIQTGLRGLVGWKKGSNPENDFDAVLEITKSGLEYQKAHPLVTIDNIAAVMLQEWDSDPNKTRKEHITDTLNELYETGVTKLVQGVLVEKTILGETKNLMDHYRLIPGLGSLTSPYPKSGKFVGLELTTNNRKGVSVKIGRLMIQAKGGDFDLTVYLFEQGNPEALEQFVVSVSGNGMYSRLETTISLSAGKRYYLGYFEDDLPVPVVAINTPRKWDGAPCAYCNNEDLTKWNRLREFVTIRAFVANPIAGLSAFDENTLSYPNMVNFGFNIELSVGCDLSDFIIDNKDLFSTALQLSVAVTTIKTLAANPNVNVSRNLLNLEHSKAIYELDGNVNTKANTSLGEQLERAIKAINIDLRGLDKECMACKSNGIKFKNVF